MTERKQKMEWTKGQQDIIEARDGEVLVSAAAGSGKTTVLVERIYQRVMNEENPVDIDRFVLVTFTNAAAAEMKERLRARMERALREETLTKQQQTHLRRQLRLVGGAHISTVHSFCNYVIGQYFHRIGIDPVFTMATESEIGLLRHDVVEELIYEEYEEGKEDFLRIAGLFSLNRFDSKLEEWILQIYDKVVSEPFPDLLTVEWERLLTTPISDESSPWLREMVAQEADIGKGIYEKCLLLEKEFFDLEDNYFRTITLIREIAKQMMTAGQQMEAGTFTPMQAYEELRTALQQAEFPRGGLPKDTPKGKPELEDVCRQVKPLREAIEDQKNEIVKPLEEMEEERKVMAETCLTFLRLTRDFSERFSQAKRERGLFDFGDLEQYALQILYDRDEETGQRTRSDAAKELADSFVEVMIDEYQDSNRVQDTILWAISDAVEEEGVPPWESVSKNRFMVGDIKQSIYRFRNACPELFEKKMRRFRTEGSKEHRLLGLQNNFRSARPVIDATNAVFREVMHEDIGGVTYDREAELTFSARMPESRPEGNLPGRVEILRIGEEHNYRVQEEAQVIANRILELVEGENPLYVRDGDSYRPVRYRDIVVLSRAVSPIAYTYSEVFRACGIPFYTKQKEGFYGSREISLMMQMLSVIDNPRQDIPLAGVVTSPMFGITEEMLAQIRICCPLKGSYDLYDRLRWAGGEDISAFLEKAIQDGEVSAELPEETASEGKSSAELPEELREKVGAFLSLLREFREKVAFSPVSSLVEDIYQKTGIYDMFAMGADGERRSGNLDYLLHIVTQFEKGSYQGVRSFIEYVGQLIEREGDEGEQILIGEQEDVVRLMSVHGSKGLEFPVVIIPRMESKGRQSGSGRFVMDTELGIAGYVDDITAGFYKKPVLYRLMTMKNKREDLGELLRLFYVAMTRAKDQLIVVAWGEEEDEPADTGYFARSGMASFFSMMRPAVVRDKAEELFVTRTVHVPAEEEMRSRSSEENIFDTIDRYNNKIKALEKSESTGTVPAKISVSDLKKSSYEEPEEVHDVDPEDLPRFMRAEKSRSFTGAERGTIYHQAMATMDFIVFADLPAESGEQAKAVDAELDRLVKEKHLRPEERKVIRVEDLVTFFGSGLGQRMVAAAVAGTLHREQPFILNRNSGQIPMYADCPSSEVMIQGIIDGYFEEDGEIVLMDYKTDRISRDHPEQLAERYHVQLELYKDALEKLLQKHVKECVLYSFCLGREIVA